MFEIFTSRLLNTVYSILLVKTTHCPFTESQTIMKLMYVLCISEHFLPRRIAPWAQFFVFYFTLRGDMLVFVKFILVKGSYLSSYSYLRLHKCKMFIF